MKTFGLYATGQKGLLVLEKLETMPSFVVTYSDTKTDEADDDIIRSLCESKGIPLFQRKDDIVHDVDLCFYVGWQYIIREDLEKSVILHDSYLPMMKGFAPTPTAMILGLPLGVTAFKPTDIEIDTGPIYRRAKIRVEYPIRLAEANEKIATHYVAIMEEMLLQYIRPEWPKEKESFCIWRDEEDMFIDWSQSSERIQRTVYALGAPLSGAKTKYRGKEIVVKDVELNDEMAFIERHSGKIWSIKENCPKVLCGTGMLTITEATYVDGSPVNFNRMRVRLGK